MSQYKTGFEFVPLSNNIRCESTFETVTSATHQYLDIWVNQMFYVSNQKRFSTFAETKYALSTVFYPPWQIQHLILYYIFSRASSYLS